MNRADRRRKARRELCGHCQAPLRDHAKKTMKCLFEPTVFLPTGVFLRNDSNGGWTYSAPTQVTRCGP